MKGLQHVCILSLMSMKVIFADCPLGWLHHEDMCYFKHRQPLSSTEARCFCQNLGGRLLTLTSPEKVVLVDEILFQNDTTNFLLGGSRLSHDQFVWDEGTVFDGFRWEFNEPNALSDDVHLCAAYMIDMSVWLPGYPLFDQHYGFDVDCWLALAFYCEKQTNVGVARGRQWKLREFGKVYLDHILSEHTTQDMVTCTILCMSKCGCYSLSYSSVHGRCVLYDAFSLRLSGVVQNDLSCGLYD